MEQNNFSMKKNDIYQIDPRKIYVVEGFNNRQDFGDIDELAAQIKEHGVLNPITVINESDKSTGEEKFRLVDGERRYRAVMKLINEGHEIARVKALFVPKNLSQEQLLIQQVLRNEGKKFNEYEWSLVCQKFVNWGYQPSEIAKMLGKSPTQISQYLGHQYRDKEVQDAIKDNKISGAKVREFMNDAKQCGYTTEEAEEAIKIAKNKAKQQEKKKITVDFIEAQLNNVKEKKDTDTIRNAFNLLMKYFNRTGAPYTITCASLFGALKDNRESNIDEILDILAEEYKDVD